MPTNIVITPSGILYNQSTAPSGPFLAITEDGVGVNTLTPGIGVSDGGVAMEVRSVDNGFALFVNQEKIGTNSGQSYGMYVRSLSEYDPAIYGLVRNDGEIKAWTQLAHPNSNIAANAFWRDADDSDVPVVKIEQANTGDDNTLLEITQSGSGKLIECGLAFSVLPGGAVLSNDTYYFKYSGTGGNPLSYGNSGAYSGYVYVKKGS